MENITKGPNIVFCKICGAMLTWEHPEGSGHYQASSDFIGGDICRSCLAERQETGCSTPEFPYSAGSGACSNRAFPGTVCFSARARATYKDV